MNAVQRVIELLERAPAAMTIYQIAEVTGLGFRYVQATLSDLRASGTADVVGKSPRLPGGPKAKHLWGVVSRAGELEMPTEPDTTRPAPCDKPDTHDDTDRPSDDDRPSSWVQVVPGTAGFVCGPRLEYVTFGQCIDSYVNATALELQSPCRKCADGAHRRDAYASGDGVRA